VERTEDLWSQEPSWKVSGSAKIAIRKEEEDQGSSLLAGIRALDRRGGRTILRWVISKSEEGFNVFLEVACFSEVNIRRA